jgi:hypothetical protein
MSSELAKVNKIEIGLTPVSENRRLMNEALARLRQDDVLALQHVRPVGTFIASPASGEVIDLPRVCAVHEQPYVARYVRDANGHFRFAQTIRITELLWEQYEAGANCLSRLPPGALHDEPCPWCGARGYGAILCQSCNAEVCYGRTDARKNFHCRASCGADGQLMNARRELMGLKPSMPGQFGPAYAKR